MSTVNEVIVSNLGLEFDIGGAVANKITLKLDGSLVKDGVTGAIGLSAASLTVVSGDVGNLIVAGSDGKAFFDQAAIDVNARGFLVLGVTAATR